MTGFAPTAADLAATATLIREEQRRIDVYLGRQMVEFPPATRALMVGPHPDDNLFGPGGTTLKYVAAGVPVQWLCVTDGRACLPDPRAREEMAVTRAREERECARRMGLPEPVLYGIREDELTRPVRTDEAVARLREDLRRFAPDAVFAPYFLESHPLHRYVTHLVARALLEERHACTVYSWAHGSFPPPSLVVDIGAEFARKRELATCYSSQLAGRDWEVELELLGRLHASWARGPADYCEVFFAQPWDAFVPDVLSRGLDRPETLGAGVQPVVAEGE